MDHTLKLQREIDELRKTTQELNSTVGELVVQVNYLTRLAHMKMKNNNTMFDQIIENFKEVWSRLQAIEFKLFPDIKPDLSRVREILRPPDDPHAGGDLDSRPGHDEP